MTVSNIPVTAFTRGGIEQTTFAQAIDDLAKQEAIKRRARRCTSCGKYQVHEDLKTVPTVDGGTEGLCPDCWDGSAAKAMYQEQWRQARERIDEIIAKMRQAYPQSDAFAKGAAIDRITAADPIGQFDKMVAHYRRQWDAEDRLATLVKAEQAREKSEKLQKRTAKLKKQSAAAQAQTELSKASLDAALAEYDELAKNAAAFTADTEARIDQMMRRLEIGQQQPLIAARARQDQIRAEWAYKAAQTTDPTIRAYYSALAAGQDPDAKD